MNKFSLLIITIVLFFAGNSVACVDYLPLEIARVGGALQLQITGFDFVNAQATARVLGGFNLSENRTEVILDLDDFRSSYGNWALNNIERLGGQTWVVPVERNAMGHYTIQACSPWASITGEQISSEFFPTTSYHSRGLGWSSLALFRDEIISYIN